MLHLDEGTIHAWLDGALSPEEAAKVDAHASECARCAALVAEARGLIAASTRILNALDDVPSGVIPSVPSDVASVPQIMKRRHWYDRTDFRAAAAILFVAGVSLVIAKSQRKSTAAFEPAAASDRAIPSAVQDTAAAAPPVAVDRLQANQPPEKSETDAAVAAVPPAARERAAERREFTGPSIVGALKARSRDEAAREDRLTAPSANAAPAPMVAQAAPPPAPAPPMEKAMQSAAGGRLGAMMDVATNRPVQGRITGRITTAQGVGLGSANVVVQGTNLAANTDSSGKFKIDDVPAGEHRLIVRRIGFSSKTIPISVNDSITTANAALDASAAALAEVVVSGVTAATAAAPAPTLRQIRADTTGTTHRTVYEVRPGVEVTLIETPATTEMESRADLDQRAKRAEAKKDSTNTITWSEGNRRYTLTGPLSTRQLDEIKTRLMRMRR